MEKVTFSQLEAIDKCEILNMAVKFYKLHTFYVEGMLAETIKPFVPNGPNLAVPALWTGEHWRYVYFAYPKFLPRSLWFRITNRIS